MVYGRYNELVFMGFINQRSHHRGSPSCGGSQYKEISTYGQMVIGHSKGPKGNPGLQRGVENPPSLGSMIVPRSITRQYRVAANTPYQVGKLVGNLVNISEGLVK